MNAVPGRIVAGGLLVLSTVVLSDSASARTWRVLRDGRGDFTTLLPACDAAAAGDTIWVGPGRYTEFEVRQVDCCQSQPVYALLQVPNLTLIGSHRDSVIIGPDTLDPNALCVVQLDLAAPAAIIESLMLQNADCGVRPSESATVRDILVRDSGQAIAVGRGSLLVENSEFVNNDTGVQGYAGSHDLTVRNCVFRDNRSGCNFTFSVDPVVENCSFSGGIVSLVASGSGVDLLLRNCSIEGAANVGVGAEFGATLRAFDNSISAAGQGGLSLGGGTFVELRRNLIYGATWATFHLSAQRGTFVVKNNHFQRGSGMLVRARNYSIEADSISIDLSGNYWNTTDPDSLAAWTFDRNDDPAEFGRVIYEPFLDAPPVSAQRESLGGLKARFRRPQ